MAITPYLLYNDVAAALKFLSKAFGFNKLEVHKGGSGGRINHAAMQLGKDMIMMGDPGPQYENPKKIGHATSMLYINVDDVDAHFKRAKKAGAKILEEPADQFYGERRYGCEDPEGHQWYFAQKIKRRQKTAK